MNPLCQCGCGREVRKPQNKYIQGHVGFQRRSLTDKQVEQARKLRSEGMSQAAIAKLLGTSQITIYNRVDAGGYVGPEKHAHKVITQADVDLKRALAQLREAKANVRERLKQAKKARRLTK